MDHGSLLDWSLARELWEAQTAPPYKTSQMREADIAEVVAGIRSWYPDVQVGMESAHLQPDFWLEKTTLVGFPNRLILPLTIHHATDGIIGMITYEQEPLALSITCRLGVLAPAHRSGGLALGGPVLLEKIGAAIGAEMAFYYATLKSKHQQVIAQRTGYRLVGIVPGYDRDMIAPGTTMRVYEALYSKLLVSEDKVMVPDAKTLTADTRAVFDVLFGRK